jgi:DNA-directed RNA polymerase specialized sigma24 family protein
MPSPASLFDQHAARLYALALRITGDEAAAAEVVSAAFLSLGDEADEASLVRATRDAALARRGRAVIAISGPPTPRTLVEAAFYGGQRVSDLSQTFALPERTVRSMLHDGMAQLARQIADAK